MRFVNPSRRSPARLAVFVAALLMAVAPAGHAARPARALSFLVVGDWGRDGNFHQRDVAQQMGRVANETHAAFVVSTGDNFYDNGVASVTAPQWQTSFENIYTLASLQIPWYVVLGNHDYRGGPAAEVDYTRVSKRWRLPARYYSQRFTLPGGGSAEFFFLDTQPFIESYRRDSRYADVAQQSRQAQLSWLEAGLAGSKADWKIVVGHHPVFSKGRHGDTPELIRDVKPLLERYGVQVYLNGHDHDMQHIVVNGVAYVTSGAGSQTRPTGHGPGTRFSLGNTSGFLAAELTQAQFTGRFIDWTGREVYAFTRARAPGVVRAEASGAR
jgi:acid phosphatase